MEKLTQLDVDKLENFISFIDEVVVDIESLINSKKLNKAKLSFNLGRLSMDLENRKQQIQDVIDTINDKDLIEIEEFEFTDRESFLDAIEDNIDWPIEVDNETTDELPF